MITTTTKSQSVWAYLQLLRPANIITAWADIFLGFAAAGAVSTEINEANFIALGWLILATTGLYGGGVVLNDVCDAELDAVERPERPIPSGRASKEGAIALGVALLSTAIIAAAMVSKLSAVLAITIAAAAFIYDKWGKHQTFLGPLNMGACRGGNLLLGVSAVPMALSDRWFLALIPIVYIAAITAISQGEVRGGDKTTGIVAIALIALVIGSILGLGFLPQYDVLITLPFLVLFAFLVLPAFVKAAVTPQAKLIQLAVKAGVLALIVLDATIAAGFTNWLYGLCLLALLPLSRLLSRLFAVT
ncbi:UbiA-like protein EboC [Myxosarcina sp. GI1]|uniref:UbiA-like protein EboC n=1 Tax=Myxosarcina sp. GI1 TaxID=1541065 RepID=UPI0005641ED5|nr:UbiA-like protein EboC [Myxosarcina sp. GI1]